MPRVAGFGRYEPELSAPSTQRSVVPARGESLPALTTQVDFGHGASDLGRVMMLVIGGFVCIAILWAYLTEVDIVATAQGRIVPLGQVKVIQPTLAGRVKVIGASEGETVDPGQILVELDATEAKSDQIRIYRELMIAKVEAARLVATLTNDEERNFAPPENADPEVVAVNRHLMLSQLNELAAAKVMAENEINERQARIKSIKSIITKYDRLLPIIQEKLNVREPLYKKGLVSKLVYLNDKGDLIEAEQDLIFQLQQLAEADASLLRLRKNHARQSALFARTRLAELADVQRRVSSLSQEHLKAQEVEQRHTLRAPVGGVVQQLRVHTIGGVVSAGERIMLIVPIAAGLEIEALIRNRDIGFVEAGQKAQIKIASFPFTRYGSIRGQLLHVSNDAIHTGGANPADSIFESSGPKATSLGSLRNGMSRSQVGPLYKARVRMDRSAVSVDGRDVNLSPGMAVTVDIRTGKRRLLEFILSPLLRYRQEGFRER